jgi:hypothetical protein
MLNAEGNWAVLVEGNSVTPKVWDDNNNSYLYFSFSSYPFNTKTVEIVGTDAIPEFPSWLILPLFIIATLSVIIVKKKLIRNW